MTLLYLLHRLTIADGGLTVTDDEKEALWKIYDKDKVSLQSLHTALDA